MNHNSYNAPSDINGIDWSLKKENYDLFLKIKNLIKLRKKLGIFNIKTKDEIIERLKFYDTRMDYVIAFSIIDSDIKYLIVHNVSSEDSKVELETISDNLELIFENDFVSKVVKEINVNAYSTNVYIVKE